MKMYMRPGERSGAGRTLCDAILTFTLKAEATFPVAIQKRSVYLAFTVCIFLYMKSECKPGPVRCEDGVGWWFWKPVPGVSHRHPYQEESWSIVLKIIFPFSSHLASLFINIRGTCKLEHAEMLSFGQECFQRAPCCSERILSSWLHWTVEQAKRC